MNVIFISECTKQALKESRRILDQFAERRGERTWQTAITMEGLKTLRRLLRKSARKNTAVACHWIRGVDHSELLWVVGNTRRFNSKGAVPTNTTQQNILRLRDENDWRTGDLIYLLSGLAALLHDLGKACLAFQQRLKATGILERNIYRHEWISLRLFQSFVDTDTDEQWLARLENLDTGNLSRWTGRLQKDGIHQETDKPFSMLPPLAAALAWLVVTHHRLPQRPNHKATINTSEFEVYFKSIDASWNEPTTETDKEKIDPYWTFKGGLPVVNRLWQKRASRLARRLQAHVIKSLNVENYFQNMYVLHMARLSLMLADHHYSSLTDPRQRISHSSDTQLYANTDSKSGALNQSLEEHLLGVAINAGYITHSLPDLERSLPRLKNHRGLRKRSAIARFRWQDKATDLATSVREQSREHGAFIINMASTGCGKTLANARIMYALAEPEQGARFSVALGLRTLTMQTGKAYREDKMYLDEEQLAVRVGGLGSRDLFEYHQQLAEKTGSESVQDLIDEEGGVLYEGDYDSHPLLKRTLHNKNTKSLIAAPVLVCTVDHLTPATESQRGGRQIAPMLRLMTSDLVLDEIDDYGLEDLPALARLVHWAGLLGSRVMLSSATLAPALVQGLFEAYKAGREQYQQNRGQPNTSINICCLWLDEYDQARQSCAQVEQFQQAHESFAQKRTEKLAQQLKQQQVRRVSDIVAVKAEEDSAEIPLLFAKRFLQSALSLHQTNHQVDPKTQKKVSFGLMRMANIDPLVEVALALFQAELPENYRLHICVYHSQFPLLLRSVIEQELDQNLDRRQPDHVFSLPRIRQLLDQHDEHNQLFVVLGSPVTEVGRDHDYDWAVVEPSSMRSMIQLVGRVRRHRPEPYLETNIHLLEQNVSSLRHPTKAAFMRPGFEDSHITLNSKKLSDLLVEEEWRCLDSRPRITARKELQAKASLVDIEHYQLQRVMLQQKKEQATQSNLPAFMLALKEDRHETPSLGAHSWWTAPYATYMSLLQQAQPFRAETTPKPKELALLLNEDETDYVLCEVVKEQRGRFTREVPIEESMLQRLPDEAVQGSQTGAWLQEDYLELVINYAEKMDLSVTECARRFGTLRLKERVNGWRFHAVLGFSANND